VVQVGVVAHPEEGLGVTPGELGIQVRDDSDLVLPADDRQDGADRRISEGVVNVGGTLYGGRSGHTRRRVLDRDKAGHLGEPSHGLLMHGGKDSRRCERR
jgi:hypothetical protein